MAQHRLPSCRLSPADVPAPCRSHPSQSRRCAWLGRPRIASCSSQIPWLKTADYADFAIHQNTTPIENLTVLLNAEVTCAVPRPQQIPAESDNLILYVLKEHARSYDRIPFALAR